MLNVGGPDAEYGVFNETVDPARFGGCPNVLTLNHFFDGANVLTHDEEVQGEVNSELTIVPCERDYLNQTANGLFTTIQFLIFNEFEQRFSTSTKVNCYKEVQLSDIDTVPGPSGNSTSIFSAGVQGTLTGMSPPALGGRSERRRLRRPHHPRGADREVGSGRLPGRLGPAGHGRREEAAGGCFALLVGRGLRGS